MSISRVPHRLVLLGAPGSGKGTYAKKIASKLSNIHSSLPIFSTGDLIRDEIKNQTSLGQAAQKASETGQLVPDDVVTSVVLARLEGFRETGYILDGFPRTIAQAESLSKYRNGELNPTTVVNINLATDVIVQKLAGRRVCTGCGTSYNLTSVVDVERGYDMPAMLPDDACLETLEIRKDDAKDVVQARLKVYEIETAPLIGYYKEKDRLVDFVVKKGLKDLPMLLKKIVKHQELTRLAEQWAIP